MSFGIEVSTSTFLIRLVRSKDNTQPTPSYILFLFAFQKKNTLHHIQINFFSLEK